MKKIGNCILYGILFIAPIFGWIIIYMSYSTWKVYKKAGYNMPNFFKYLYQHNFEPYTSYKKNTLTHAK